ncbi:MAG: PKD domain-containing protein [Candidatus Pacebacteria bacterium]|nr:PKD domain-containing protein [Candidatus Paceibacterota bacterium]
MNLSIIKKSASEKLGFLINVLISVVFIFSAVMFLRNWEPAEAGSAQNTTGFAWSENIGWISFNNLTGGGTSSYGVNLNLDTGIFSGFAWSENIGWITFNAADLSGCPSGVCDARVDSPADIGDENLSIEGWARALSYGGGWDGWISLRDPSAGGGGIGGNDSYAKLLLHMDDMGLTNSSAFTHVMTPNGNVARSSSQSKFGGYSAAFDGSGDYLSTPNSSDWDFSGDFTVDFWVYLNSINTHQNFVGRGGRGTADTDGWNLWRHADGTLYFTYDKSGSVILMSRDWTSAQLHTWYHLALVRNGTKIRMYVNGVQLGADYTDASITNINAGNYDLRVGAHWNGDMGVNGYIDELRISKDIARWTSNFTPSAAAYDEGENPGAYGATMDTSGNWSGWAWGGDVVGWVNFNGSGYQVNTSFVPPSGDPEATDLSVSEPGPDTYCNIARHTFSWTYSDPLEKAESRFQMQVDNNSDFLSPEVDRNQSGLSYPSPTINTQQVLVIDVPESDKLVYGETYNWRVKVYNDDNGHSDWIVGTPFTTDYVEYPTVVYTWLPFKPNEDDVVQFTDSSTVTEGASTTERVWEFQDGSPGTSVEQSPMTTFLSQGSKQVSLRITDSNGKSCTLLSTVEVKWPLPNWKEILPF